jgi:hypothetical protein
MPSRDGWTCNGGLPSKQGHMRTNTASNCNTLCDRLSMCNEISLWRDPATR